MKGFQEILGIPLKPQTGAVSGPTPDLAGLWERWAAQGPAVLLESAGPLGAAGQWIILAGLPEFEFFGGRGRAWWKDFSGTRPATADFWDFADQVGKSKPEFQNLPACLAQAWFGALSYDFGKNFNLKKSSEENSTTGVAGDTEPRNNFLKPNHYPPFLGNPDQGNRIVPDFYFFKPSQVIAFNRQTRESHFFGIEPAQTFKLETPPRVPFNVHGLRNLAGLSDYTEKVRRAQGYIAQGDIYQANLAQVFLAQWEGSAGTLYRILREMNPGPFMGLLQGNGFTVVSSSPERLAAGRGEWLETRPIAGTRPRGKDGPEDSRMKVELKTNAKEQAEHLMLVDLARNDLGRVSRYGTVEVERYAEIESYARVHHLVSTVKARRKPDCGLPEILQSLFPGGTITGCPKIRCMEIIDELEGRPRGFYTGSMGYLAPGPCFDLNILIRSFTLFPSGTLEFQAGAGIVADSSPEKEYQETLYKVEALAQALGTSLVENP